MQTKCAETGGKQVGSSHMTIRKPRRTASSLQSHSLLVAAAPPLAQHGQTRRQQRVAGAQLRSCSGKKTSRAHIPASVSTSPDSVRQRRHLTLHTPKGPVSIYCLCPRFERLSCPGPRAGKNSSFIKQKRKRSCSVISHFEYVFLLPIEGGNS